ncbi:hypothetical protein GEV33_008159 [Tenebrio molitor]|jgi:hypothetical protein|uniref:Uncharacterized protein n=1 Tax=Tenebrio molitor TaxID=7067 RepID=A0A8J6HHA7_TENMO|nr:hypothetical protein GEV33_008159 [Tenebrio molitor]
MVKKLYSGPRLAPKFPSRGKIRLAVCSTRGAPPSRGWQSPRANPRRRQTCEPRVTSDEGALITWVKCGVHFHASLTCENSVLCTLPAPGGQHFVSKRKLNCSSHDRVRFIRALSADWPVNMGGGIIAEQKDTTD